MEVAKVPRMFVCTISFTINHSFLFRLAVHSIARTILVLLEELFCTAEQIEREFS